MADALAEVVERLWWGFGPLRPCSYSVGQFYGFPFAIAACTVNLDESEIVWVSRRRVVTAAAAAILLEQLVLNILRTFVQDAAGVATMKHP